MQRYLQILAADAMAFSSQRNVIVYVWIYPSQRKFFPSRHPIIDRGRVIYSDAVRALLLDNVFQTLLSPQSTTSDIATLATSLGASLDDVGIFFSFSSSFSPVPRKS